jgi:FAD/FMN-containing dehydrogenase
MSTDSAAAAAARDLRARLGADRVRVRGPAYDRARRVWNGAVDHRPALIVRPGTPAGVQTAVLTARTYDLPISVRGSGHDWAGRAMRPGGLVIDLAGMRQVTVNAGARIAAVAGGATARPVVAAAAPHDLVAATATCGGVGLAGLTSVGGYGPLTGRFGLALDNLLGAEVVLADGRLVTADAAHEPGLFWAIRGGGGNFGVLTRLRIRLHPLRRLLAGFIVFPWDQAAGVWQALRSVLAGAPDELTVQSGIRTGPDASPWMFLSAAWSGEPAHGEKAIEELLRLGTPLLSHIVPRSYSQLPGQFDASIADGRHYAIRTRSVTAFTPEVVAALAEAGSALTSRLSLVSTHHFHGAAALVPADATAFGLRHEHFTFEIVAAWEPHDARGARHRAWADSLSARLAPHALPGGYPGLLGPDDHDQIAHAYGPNDARLRAAKARYDPDGIFAATPGARWRDVTVPAVEQGPWRRLGEAS